MSVNIKVQVERPINSQSQDHLNEPFINEQYEPGSKDYNEALRHEIDESERDGFGCLCASIRAFIWLTFGMGMAMSIYWFDLQNFLSNLLAG